jgi:hypothetical protein
MTIKRNDKEIIVTLSANIDTGDLQEMLDYLRYKEITSQSKASQSDIDKLVKRIKKGRWAKRRKKLLSK